MYIYSGVPQRSAECFVAGQRLKNGGEGETGERARHTRIVGTMFHRVWYYWDCPVRLKCMYIHTYICICMSDVGLLRLPAVPCFSRISILTVSHHAHARVTQHWPRHCVRGSATREPPSASQQTSRLPASQRCSKGAQHRVASLEEHAPDENVAASPFP